MKIFIINLIGFLLTIIHHQTSSALELSKMGDVVMMSGYVNGGDDALFKDFMADPNNANIKVIRLNSTGGMAGTATRIGRLIRHKNLTTLVDGKTDNCFSACTILFSSGVRRHYINAQLIKDGVYSKPDVMPGLGFHEAHDYRSPHSHPHSGEGTAGVIAAFYEFGTKNAVDLVTLAPPNKLYYISSQTALNLGIATSLSAP